MDKLKERDLLIIFSKQYMHAVKLNFYSERPIGNVQKWFTDFDT